MKRLLTLLFFAFFAITTQAQTVPNLPPGSVPFGTGLFRDPDGDIWGGSKFDGYVNLGNWQRVADSLGAKINWSDTTIIASKEWVEGKLNSLPPSGVLSVTGDGVDNTDPANPVLSYPDPSDIGALAPGDDVSELTNDAGYLTTETDPVYSGDPASGITQNDIDAWDAKQDAITGAATTVVQNNLTPSRALISNGSGKIAVSPVSSTELAFLDGVSSNVQDQLDDKIPLAQKGASNGVAPIGSDGKIPGEYLPSSGSYKGTWDASTNTPTIADGVGTNGDRYRVSVGGTVDLGSGPITFVAGDDVIYNGTVWQRSPSGVTVTSVAGKTGDVILDKNDVGLGNVDNTSDMDKPISNAVQDALDLKLDASEISNYYTKTQMQTSGQAQVHWENITNVPGNLGVQTLSLGPGSGEISISGGNNIRLTDLFSRTSDSFDDFTRARGLFPYTYLSTATGYVGAAGGTGIRSNRSGTSYVGAFDIIAPNSGAPRLMFNVGSGAETWAGWQTFASEEWISNNYYTKTNLQTSGQSQVHWGNITNVPGGLGVQTLSTSQGANNLTISGGNSVTLNNLYYKSAPNFPDDVTSQSSGFHPLNISSGTGWPSSFGYALLARRPSGENNNNGSFVLYKSSTNDNKIRYSTGAGETWNTFSTFASEEHVAANYVTLGTNQTITSVKTLTGSAIPLRLQAADLAIYIPFLASDGTTRKGYIGFPTTSPSDIFINNDSGGTLKVKSGINGLTYDYGSGDKTVWHSGNLDPDGFLKLSSASSQEVTGPVVFSGNPQVPLTPASSNSAIAKGYLDNTLTSYALDNSVVKLTGNQNIFGEKTFEGTVRHYGGLILENEPISDKMAATKKYVDDAIAEIDIEGTDLGITGTTGARTITSSTGTGAVIPAANGAVSGVMTPTHVNQLVTAYGHTLQSVTNNGRVTNNGIVITGGGISANSNSLQIFKNTNNVGQIGYFYPSGGGVAQGAFFSLQADTAILGIGNAASSMKIYIDGGPKLDFLGDVTATEFYRTSTRKIKKDITPFSENATSILNGVDVVEYKLKKGPDYKKIGFIAEDTHEYLATPEHNVMDQGSTIGLLIKAVQELSAKVEELERRLSECQE